MGGEEQAQVWAESERALQEDLGMTSRTTHGQILTERGVGLLEINLFNTRGASLEHHDIEGPRGWIGSGERRARTVCL